MKSLNLELPVYVWTELKIGAAQRQISLKHVVMTALAKDGVTIKGCRYDRGQARLR